MGGPFARIPSLSLAGPAWAGLARGSREASLRPSRRIVAHVETQESREVAANPCCQTVAPRVAAMDRRTFSHRAETFGFDTDEPWALDALRLLFNAPRAYEPLVRAYETRHRGTRRALRRLVGMGFVAYQPAVVMDTRTGLTAAKPTRVVARYRTTAAGQRILAAADEDLRTVESTFPRTGPGNLEGVLAILSTFDLEGSHRRWGLSSHHAIAASGMPERSARWWINRLVEAKMLRRLSDKVADVRAVVPAHWRVTRRLARQLDTVIDAFEVPATLKLELRLRRGRYLGDIDPARLGVSGATDFDHDVQAQLVVGSMMRSARFAPEGLLVLEPRYYLPYESAARPWRFDPQGTSSLYYQPDAEIRERDEHGVRRSVVEFERYQTRRDGWSHIERFLGYLHTRTLPFEAAVLRFVVDSDQRVASYVELIEAFCDHALERPELLVSNPVTLAVSSVSRVQAATDPLDWRIWHRLALPQGGTGAPVLHHVRHSPYDEFFAR